MSSSYAKVIVQGSPLSKSNFKLFNSQGRAILPYNSGKYHDRYAHYEETIAYEARLQNPDIILTEALIAVLKVYYKSEKRHPDTNNITKSIMDGIEKSGIIINDAQIRRLIIEEFYDKENPRFELELYGESTYVMNYSVDKRTIEEKKIEYLPPSNKRTSSLKAKENTSSKKSCTKSCDICRKAIEEGISADRGKIFICKECFKKLF
ncbi:RusA family crossover junction endodeoxyribonuclease [Alloiococcus sp. CFN-8]|uniref:RusA family crossover junction endodeoxyribonuclease n=1 Tax=Alloiococcus sp. CFN-8 TaxID=3416081 RepID=UPI003CF69705